MDMRNKEYILGTLSLANEGSKRVDRQTNRQKIAKSARRSSALNDPS